MIIFTSIFTKKIHRNGAFLHIVKSKTFSRKVAGNVAIRKSILFQNIKILTLHHIIFLGTIKIPQGEAKILDKDTIDEKIFRTTITRNRIMLELMARAGMRISEVLNLTPNDIDERKLILRKP